MTIAISIELAHTHTLFCFSVYLNPARGRPQGRREAQLRANIHDDGMI